MLETRDIRLKRLRMRAMRRGIREMDLILVAYADARLAAMDPSELDLFDRLLSENDQDLYAWVTGREAAPDWCAGMIAQIAQALQHR
jgi:antitoxin CptB